jgi:hypothetical protein
VADVNLTVVVPQPISVTVATAGVQGPAGSGGGGGAAVSDTAYDATSWNGVTDTAPSKNAVRDKVELIETEIAGKASSSHSHAESDITGLVSDLAGKASSVHSHAIADVTGLQTALDAKSDLSHAHAISDVTGLQSALDGKQALDTDLTDIAALAPTNDDVIQRKAGAWTNRSMTQLKSDLSLSNVDNTSDANKPVSTAQQTALDLKANLAGPTFTGTVGGITKSMVGLGSVDNTSDASKPVSTAQAAADAAVLASAIQRANHTGTQLASTISDFNEAAEDAVGGILTDTATIDFTYDDTGNAITADVKADSIGVAKMHSSATDKLFGRDTASSGAGEEIAVSGGLEFTGSGGIQRSALTGDVTATAGSNATTIANDAVTYAKMQNVSATDKVLGRSSSGSGDVEEITCTSFGRSLLADANAAAGVTTLGLDNSKITEISFQIDGGGSVITANSQGWKSIPFACTINSARLLADVSGSMVIDVWKAAYASYPPTVSNTITASAKPTISAATKAEDTTLTGWTTSVSAGDVIKINVDSCSTIAKAVLTLKVTKT